MIRSMENEKLCIKISDYGAELSGLFDKENNREILWQADSAYWKRHAPVLFPYVGKHYGNEYRINGITYPAPSQHGFARDLEFVCIAESDTSVTHELKSSEKTRERYPFDFTLQITHTLSGNELTVEWKVSNASDETMYFTIGGHPAFNVPLLEGTTYDQYSLYFPDKDALSYKLIDPNGSGTLIPDVEYAMELKDHHYAIDLHTFDRDALVFDGGQITRAGLALPDGTPFLEIHAEGFPNFGIWAAPQAPFVCLEPWMGRTDDFCFSKDLSEKENINALAKGEVFCKSYTITVF